MEKKLSDFIIKYNKYEDRDKIIEYIEQHKLYETLDYAVDDRGDIVAVVRWNVDNDCADVLDFCVSDEYKNKKLGREFIKRAMIKFPEIKYISYKRGVRGDDRIRKIKIDFILNRNIF